MPETSKYGGIKEEFQSVLGNFKSSPRGQGAVNMSSVDYSPHTYGGSSLVDYNVA